MAFPREPIKDWFTRIDELLIILIENQKKTNELLTKILEIEEKQRTIVETDKDVAPSAGLQYTIDLISLVDKEFEFIIDLSVERNDEPLGIQSRLKGQTPFVTQFVISRLVGEPLIVKLNSTGAPTLTLKEGEGMNNTIINELFITNSAQEAGSEARIIVAWNSLIPKVWWRR
jgi:hypothetical protein